MCADLNSFLVKWLGAEAPGTLAVDGKGTKAELIEKVNRWVASSGRNVTQPGELTRVIDYIHHS